MSFKYRLLKAVDTAGLNFLRPVILLCYGEEPDEQIRQIGLFIVVPIVAFVAFLCLWGLWAPSLKTKSGEVPTPAVVWDSAKGIWQFHARESNKMHAYEVSGEERENMLQAAKARLTEIESLEKRVGEQLKEADAAMEAYQESSLAPLKEAYKEKRTEFRDAQKARLAALKTIADSAEAGDTEARDAYLKQYHEHLAKEEEEREVLREMKAEQNAVRSERFPQRTEALRAQTVLAEEKQYLVKLVDTLENNKEQKLESDKKELRQELDAFYAADGNDMEKLAKSVVRIESRIDSTESSSYAKPMTLPDQILRSVACVFAGFVIASMIAIPTGIVCGLSRIFMAAVTPFIALFKPVSPIVWLPIFFIIVGGFIPDPDKHWLITALANAPLIGWMKINPAFIASALTVAMCSLWPTLVNTAFGVASIDKDHINVARVLRLGFWSRLFKIVIPSSLPLTFAGLRISLGVGWMVLIAAELLSSSEGLGKFVWDMFNNGSSQTFAQMFVVVFVVGIIGLLLDRIMIVFQRLVSFDESPSAL